MNNLLPYSGLIDAKIRASDKDLPVHMYEKFINFDRTLQLKRVIKYLIFGALK